jgi:hypothetical protein
LPTFDLRLYLHLKYKQPISAEEGWRANRVFIAKLMGWTLDYVDELRATRPRDLADVLTVHDVLEDLRESHRT